MLYFNSGVWITAGKQTEIIMKPLLAWTHVIILFTIQFYAQPYCKKYEYRYPWAHRQRDKRVLNADHRPESAHVAKMHTKGRARPQIMTSALTSTRFLQHSQTSAASLRNIVKRTHAESNVSAQIPSQILSRNHVRRSRRRSPTGV